MARRHSTRFVRPRPATKMWVGTGVGLTAIAANTKVLVGSLSAGALLLRPFTILRTRMEIFWGSDQLAASEDPQGDYGQIVVTDTASAIGVTAVPDPSVTDGDPEADWFVHQPVATSLGFSDATGIVLLLTRFTIDSKAMRKVGPDDNIVSLFSETGNHGGSLFTRGRRLVQLH